MCYCFMFRVNKMFLLALVLCLVSRVTGQPGLCHQMPRDPQAPPRDASIAPYTLEIESKTNAKTFSQGQTYVLILETKDTSRLFKEFMITVEDPEVDNNPYQFNHRQVEVGELKTLDTDFQTQFSTRCSSTVENRDISDKRKIVMHWVSPKQPVNGQRIRFRAMVAENNEVWYSGLNFTLEKDDSQPKDRVPLPVNPKCAICSEARYEVVFKGVWSQGTHSYQYPSHPDENKFSEMVGASHAANFYLWEPNRKASPALKELAEHANSKPMEIDIVSNMSSNKVRTLIKGKMHKHPHMSEPSRALFRVDKTYHLFSLVVAMKPSPDWFLGTTQFELCSSENQWLESYEMPMYPWDAGTRDGISYESQTSVTNPVDSVDRVALGSFSKESPFYQMNLNDLRPFAFLEVRKLDEYPTNECSEGADQAPSDTRSEDAEDEDGETNADEDDTGENPIVAEWRPNDGDDECPEDEEWSPCIPDDGDCGLGVQTRIRFWKNLGYFQNNIDDEYRVRPLSACRREVEYQTCSVRCPRRPAA